MTRNEIATTRPINAAPRLASQALDLALAAAVSSLENGHLPADSLPSGARVGLASRARYLDDAMTPATREAVASVLASVSNMPSKTEIDPAKVKAFLELDMADIIASKLPIWALEAAARAYRLGDVGEGHWRPTAGDLVTCARQKAASAYRERQQIAAVLSAKVDPPKKPASPEQRKELADRIRALAAGMSVS